MQREGGGVVGAAGEAAAGRGLSQVMLLGVRGGVLALRAKMVGVTMVMALAVMAAATEPVRTAVLLLAERTRRDLQRRA